VTNKPAPRVSPVLLVVLVVALATGAAASILVAASTAPPPPPGSSSLVMLPQWAIAALSFAVILFILGGLVIWRLSSSRHLEMNRLAVSILAVILLGMFFVIAARVVGFGGQVGTGTGSGGGNSTSGANGTNPLHGGNLTGPGGQITLFPNVPGWVPFVILGVVVLLIVVVGIPQTRRYLADRREISASRRRTAVSVPSGMREALTRASAELDLGGDPRFVILALYGRMLQYLQPMVGAIETSTPEEIRAAHLVRLGVRPEAASTLTHLFEEARYSTHPMGPAESARAQGAVRATLDDLARRTSPE
jgi:hypothetical protein